MFKSYNKIRLKNNFNSLVKLEGRIIAIIYINVLENSLLFFIDSLDNQENYIFQKNNIFIYTIRIVKS